MENGVTVVTHAFVDVRLTSTVSSFEVQRRYNRGLTIADLKRNLEMIVGANASSMDLELFSVTDNFVQRLDDNEALLGSYPVDDNCRIHVIDRSGALSGEYSDVSKVEKFEISDDAYEQRTESARSFLKKQGLGRFNEEEMAKKQAEQADRENKQKAAADAITVGSRCQVQVAGQPTKLGTVMYVGTTDFKSGYWVGVKYDEPLGKHDGSVQGKRYFECQNKYGAFVKPLNVTVGDFPEEDYGLDEI
ncbi:tubulin-folding cofactor B [Thalassophryne amazonica]|uniref:tubulin-folding cofactor B n=1 Tax=Thalassophryne amazonica TaxID=390379 RepID=UPI0014708DF5|nr:tubulin-folding cofactor B [Thalassophryne amazonica]XP_034025113.1 tubulin-folding cofactor B [Thalassophryne amazonica]